MKTNSSQSVEEPFIKEKKIILTLECVEEALIVEVTVVVTTLLTVIGQVVTGVALCFVVTYRKKIYSKQL